MKESFRKSLLKQRFLRLKKFVRKGRRGWEKKSVVYEASQGVGKACIKIQKHRQDLACSENSKDRQQLKIMETRGQP